MQVERIYAYANANSKHSSRNSYHKNATQCNYGVLTRRNKPELTDDLSQCKQTSVDMAAFF